MKGTVLYGPRDVRFEERDDADDHRADRCHHPDLGHLRVRVRPVALPRHQPDQRADADGARVLRHRRGGRQRGTVGQAGAVRHRLVRHVRQHLSELPGRLPVVVHAPRVHDSGASAGAARAAGGRDAGADAGRSSGRPGPEPADDVGRAGHRLVRRRCGQREAGFDRRGRRRRRGRPARRCSRPSRWVPSGSSR